MIHTHTPIFVGLIFSKIIHFQEGLTALMMATTTGQESIVEILLHSGRVDINSQEKVCHCVIDLSVLTIVMWC